MNTQSPITVHDAYIWKNSIIRKDEKFYSQIKNAHFWLLGKDLRMSLWKLSFNDYRNMDTHWNRGWWHHFRHNPLQNSCITRNIAKQVGSSNSKGLLKNRWWCLLKYRMLHSHPEVTSNIVVSCVVVHNKYIHQKIEVDIELESIVYSKW